jgi:hypothetical protein
MLPQNHFHSKYDLLLTSLKVEKACQQIIYIWTTCMEHCTSIIGHIFFFKISLILVSICNEVSQCAGREISLDCSSSDWLIHVEYEVYGYNNTNDCVVSADTCTGTEFLDPPSVTHCNGRASCVFMVPTNKYLSVCQKNATSLKIVYQCVPSMYTKTFFHHQELS